MMSMKSATARLKSSTVLLFQGLKWKQKMKRAKPFPARPRTNSVTSSGGSTLISTGPLKLHSMSAFGVALMPADERMSPRKAVLP